jgi:hypothetical protein
MKVDDPTPHDHSLLNVRRLLVALRDTLVELEGAACAGPS